VASVAHFGTGGHTIVDVVISDPAGAELARFLGLQTDRYLTVPGECAPATKQTG